MVTISMDIVTRMHLEIAIQLIITEITTLIKQTNLRMDELNNLMEK